MAAEGIPVRGNLTVLSTSDPDLSAEDVALAHNNLLEVGRPFLELRTTLELRPVVHVLEHGIRARTCCCAGWRYSWSGGLSGR
jgi:hypothetical protein